MSSAACADLRRAATYRFLSLLFVPPTARLANDIRTLAPEILEPLIERADALADLAGPELGHVYHRALGPSGDCRDIQSAYDASTIAGRGPLLADIAGFYGAFAYEPADLGPMTPDHASVELGFLAYLAVKTAYARHRNEDEQVEVCEQAADSFVRRHAGQWLPTFLQALHDTAGGGFYADAARLAADALVRLEDGKLTLPAEQPHRPLPVLDDDDACVGT